MGDLFIKCYIFDTDYSPENTFCAIPYGQFEKNQYYFHNNTPLIVYFLS